MNGFVNDPKESEPVSDGISEPLNIMLKSFPAAEADGDDIVNSEPLTSMCDAKNILPNLLVLEPID